MKTAKVGMTAGAVALLSLLVFIVRQERRVARWSVETVALRRQVPQAPALQEQSLNEQLRRGVKGSRTEADEMAHLRSQASLTWQIEQELARGKNDRDWVAGRQRAASPPRMPDHKTPEWKVAQARMRFSKVLGLAIRSFANDHQGQMPPDVLTALSAQTAQEFARRLADQLPSDTGEIRPDQFELVYRGNLNHTGRPPGSTIIARTTQPIRLSNGRWARPCVFDDANSSILVADTLEELAAKEKKLMPVSPVP